jgi:hypothetical protein
MNYKNMVITEILSRKRPMQNLGLRAANKDYEFIKAYGQQKLGPRA